MIHEKLKERWLNSIGLINLSQSDYQFKIVCGRYSERHRYYHTLEHIESCLSLFDEISSKINNSQVVEIALWLHDVIYNPKKKDNEEKSALFANQLLKNAGFDNAYIETVNKLIMATKHPALPTTIEEKYIIDIDLAILGAPEEMYDHYSDQIMKEYSHIPLILYKRGRMKVLESFLKQKAIYNTEYFGGKYEMLARNNLERENRRLKCS